jgi:hypothetical protein
VDIELRFFVPVRVQRFALDDNNQDITFSRALGPLDISVDWGKIAIHCCTVVPDRTDFNAVQRLRRSPSETHNHRCPSHRWRMLRVLAIALMCCTRRLPKCWMLRRSR